MFWGGGILNKTEYQEQLENDNVLLAIYINENEIDQIPLKDAGYIFDETKSSCSNNATITWDYETWSPVVKNVSSYPTRCKLSFRNYYVVNVYENDNIETYQVSTNTSNVLIEANSDSTILNCNNAVKLSFSDGFINVQNVKSDVLCKYYNTSFDAIANIDNSENYFIYLKDENIQDDLIINEGKALTMDLNGVNLSINKSIYNYANLNIVSTKNVLGKLYASDTNNVLFSYNSSNLFFDNVEVSSVNSTINIYDKTVLNANNSRLLSNSSTMSSTIWLHNGETTVNIYNSLVDGPFAIGGEGGPILIDSSHLIGNEYVGLQVNSGYSGNLIIQNNSIIEGYTNGVSMADGTIVLGSNIDDNVTIKGETQYGIAVGYGNSIFNINYNSGDIYGGISLGSLGQINVIDGKTMVSEEENGIIHVYLK